MAHTILGRQFEIVQETEILAASLDYSLLQ